LSACAHNLQDFSHFQLSKVLPSSLFGETFLVHFIYIYGPGLGAEPPMLGLSEISICSTNLGKNRVTLVALN